MSLPPLAAIRCFEAAARHLSFTRAAGELGMTQAAVSYQIKLLEERYGPLFLRRARGVELTDTGQRLAPAISEAFAQLRAAFERAGQASGSLLVISSSNAFATSWLVPNLGTFQLAHPGIAVRLEVSSHLVDFGREEVDVAIRGGRGNWPGLVAHRLMALEFTPMLSPRLLDRYGPLREPADLLRFPLIEPHDPWWADWFATAGVPASDLSQRPDLSLGTQPLAARAATAGQGVAILSPSFYREEVAEGRLMQPFPLVHTAESSYWLVYPEMRRNAPKIRVFRDWLLAAVADGG